MESRVPILLFLELINVLVHRGIEVKGDGDFNPVPEMVEQHEMVGANVVEPGVKRDVFDDSP